MFHQKKFYSTSDISFCIVAVSIMAFKETTCTWQFVSTMDIQAGKMVPLVIAALILGFTLHHAAFSASANLTGTVYVSLAFFTRWRTIPVNPIFGAISFHQAGNMVPSRTALRVATLNHCCICSVYMIYSVH